MIYAQAMVSEKVPAGACLEYVLAGDLKLAGSDSVLREIRTLPAKLPARFQVTSERAEAFIAAVSPFAENVTVPLARKPGTFAPDSRDSKILPPDVVLKMLRDETP